MLASGIISISMRLRLALLTCALAAVAFAADVTGKWTAEMQGRGRGGQAGQTQTITFNLKADGGILTGSVSGRGGDTEITDGKIDGENISFSITRTMGDRSFKMNYNGTISGDEIKFKAAPEGGQNPGREFTAKRAPTT